MRVVITTSARLLVAGLMLSLTACACTGKCGGRLNKEVETGVGAPVEVTVGETKSVLQQAGIQDRVFFAFNKFNLNKESVGALSDQAKFLQNYLSQNPESVVIVKGHADNRGTKDYNLELSIKRANASKKQLAKYGVPQSRMSIIGYGKEDPIVLGDNEEAWQQNRVAITDITVSSENK